jgi:hypothetical protein
MQVMGMGAGLDNSLDAAASPSTGDWGFNNRARGFTLGECLGAIFIIPQKH